MTSYRKQLLKGINKFLDLVGLELIRKGRAFEEYIPLERTLREAATSGLPLGEFIDNRYNLPGVTQLTIDKMLELNVFKNKIERVCEIGPGSGRYLEKVLGIAKPEYYEIYETAKPWRRYLVEKYQITAQYTDGYSLSSTPSKSLDLIHTHKMLYGNPIVTICKYFKEMVRVVKDDGYIVFDILTEQCMTIEMIEKWISSGVQHACSMTPKQVAVDFFIGNGFHYIGGFVVPLAPGVTEYFIFKK